MPTVDEAKQLVADQRYAEAADAYRELLKDEPHHAGYLRGLAMALHGAGDDAAAVPFAREAAQLHPVSGDNRYALGIALIGSGEDAEGVHELEMALTLQPNHAGALHAYGDEMLKLAKHAPDAQSADAFLEKVVRLDPKRADVVAARIKIALATQQADLAKRFHQEMHAHTGDDTRLFDALRAIGVDPAHLTGAAQSGAAQPTAATPMAAPASVHVGQSQPHSAPQSHAAGQSATHAATHPGPAAVPHSPVTHTPATGQSLTGNAAGSTMIDCPFCKQPILALAAVCPYCKLTIRANASHSSFNIDDKPIWQITAYNIMCWVLLAFYGISAAIGFGLFGNETSGATTYGAVFDAAKAFLAVGLFFRNEIAAALMRWSLWLSLAWNLAAIVISLMMTATSIYWLLIALLVVVKSALEIFMLYLINFEND